MPKRNDQFYTNRRRAYIKAGARGWIIFAEESLAQSTAAVLEIAYARMWPSGRFRLLRAEQTYSAAPPRNPLAQHPVPQLSATQDGLTPPTVTNDAI